MPEALFLVVKQLQLIFQLVNGYTPVAKTLPIRRFLQGRSLVCQPSLVRLEGLPQFQL